MTDSLPLDALQMEEGEIKESEVEDTAADFENLALTQCRVCILKIGQSFEMCTLYRGCNEGDCKYHFQAVLFI